MNSNPYIPATESTDADMDRNANRFSSAPWHIHLFCIILLALSLAFFPEGRVFVVLSMERFCQLLRSIASRKLSMEINESYLFAATYQLALLVSLCCHLQAFCTGFTSKALMLPSCIVLAVFHGFAGLLDLITLDLFCWCIFLYAVLSTAIAFGLTRQFELE